MSLKMQWGRLRPYGRKFESRLSRFIIILLTLTYTYIDLRTNHLNLSRSSNNELFIAHMGVWL